MRSRVESVKQSPLNGLRWRLQLDCGHDGWVTAKRRPTRTTFDCSTCRMKKAEARSRRSTVEGLMEHTPGPWKVIAIGKRRVISSGHGYLVETPKRGEPETELQAKKLEADYSLMAAAPELLTACREAYRLMKNSPGNWESQTAEMLYAAISKADGTAKVG